MERLLIKPKDIAELKLIKQLLQKMKISVEILSDNNTPISLTPKTIKNAQCGKVIGEPIKNIKDYRFVIGCSP